MHFNSRCTVVSKNRFAGCKRNVFPSRVSMIFIQTINKLASLKSWKIFMIFHDRFLNNWWWKLKQSYFLIKWTKNCVWWSWKNDCKIIRQNSRRAWLTKLGLGTLTFTNYHMSRQVSYSLAVRGIVVTGGSERKGGGGEEDKNVAKGSVMLILKNT